MASEPDPQLSDIDNSPDTLPAVIPATQVPDLKQRFDEVADENFDLKAENAALKRKLSSKEATDAILGPSSRGAYRFLYGYGAGSLGILLLEGFHYRGFDLSDTILGLVVGSTAVSAIGLVGLVIRGIFQITNAD